MSNNETVKQRILMTKILENSWISLYEFLGVKKFTVL